MIDYTPSSEWPDDAYIRVEKSHGRDPLTGEKTGSHPSWDFTVSISNPVRANFYGVSTSTRLAEMQALEQFREFSECDHEFRRLSDCGLSVCDHCSTMSENGVEDLRRCVSCGAKEAIYDVYGFPEPAAQSNCCESCYFTKALPHQLARIQEEVPDDNDYDSHRVMNHWEDAIMKRFLRLAYDKLFKSDQYNHLDIGITAETAEDRYEQLANVTSAINALTQTLFSQLRILTDYQVPEAEIAEKAFTDEIIESLFLVLIHYREMKHRGEEPGENPFLSNRLIAIEKKSLELLTAE